MPVPEPVARSSTSASAPCPRFALCTLHALLVEVQQPVLAVVGVLQRGVCRAVVEPPELVALVERGRVERLATAELLHDALAPPVARAGPLTVDHWHRRPESEVHVRRLGFERVEVPARGRVAL